MSIYTTLYDREEPNHDGKQEGKKALLLVSVCTFIFSILFLSTGTNQMNNTLNQNQAPPCEVRCPKCGAMMEIIHTASGTQADGCDVDIDTYACRVCGNEESD